VQGDLVLTKQAQWVLIGVAICGIVAGCPPDSKANDERQLMS